MKFVGLCNQRLTNGQNPSRFNQDAKFFYQSDLFYQIREVWENEVEIVNQKEKMLELIKKKQGGGRSKQMDTPKNDRKNMRKGPKIYNK